MVDYVKFEYPSRLQIIDNPMNLGPLRASQLVFWNQSVGQLTLTFIVDCLVIEWTIPNTT